MSEADVARTPTIRGMELADASKVSELCSQLGYSRLQEQVREWIEGLSSRGGTQAAFVACMDGQVEGWVEVSVQRDLQTAPFGLIGGLVVSERVRGGGVGKILCQRAEAWAVEQGVSVMRVTSRSTREKAHRFYLRDGYEQLKTSLVFEKKLADGQ